MSISGFKLLYSGGCNSGGYLGEIIDIRLGIVTHYALILTVERAGGEMTLKFNNPLTFRVQEESDLLSYWSAREKEGVQVGLLYKIGSSLYRDEFRTTISGMTKNFNHYLVTGIDLCVEVLSADPPELLEDLQ